jgi:hypothetical protein
MQHFPDNSLSTSADWEQALFQISQAHLNLLAVCPRKFQHVYLDQLGLPQIPEEQERLDLGNRFHLLIQQRELGLPIESLVQADTQLQRWFDAFNQTPPQILSGERQSEHRRVLHFQSYLLVGVYDLLVLGEQQAQILDWKTYSRPQNQQWLKQSWQTRLYPYILAETSDYLPEQICMTYWFAESKGKRNAEPHSLTFPYNTALHEQTRQDLAQALGNLAGWLETYYEGGLFSQVAVEAGQCYRDDGEASSCRFAIRCQRNTESNKLNVSTFDNDIGSIQELPL